MNQKIFNYQAVEDAYEKIFEKSKDDPSGLCGILAGLDRYFSITALKSTEFGSDIQIRFRNTDLDTSPDFAKGMERNDYLVKASIDSLGGSFYSRIMGLAQKGEPVAKKIKKELLTADADFKQSWIEKDHPDYENALNSFLNNHEPNRSILSSYLDRSLSQDQYHELLSRKIILDPIYRKQSFYRSLPETD